MEFPPFSDLLRLRVCETCMNFDCHQHADRSIAFSVLCTLRDPRHGTMNRKFLRERKLRRNGILRFLTSWQTVENENCDAPQCRCQRSLHLHFLVRLLTTQPTQFEYAMHVTRTPAHSLSWWLGAHSAKNAEIADCNAMNILRIRTRSRGVTEFQFETPAQLRQVWEQFWKVL